MRAGGIHWRCFEIHSLLRKDGLHSLSWDDGFLTGKRMLDSIYYKGKMDLMPCQVMMNSHHCHRMIYSITGKRMTDSNHWQGNDDSHHWQENDGLPSLARDDGLPSLARADELLSLTRDDWLTSLARDGGLPSLARDGVYHLLESLCELGHHQGSRRTLYITHKQQQLG